MNVWRYNQAERRDERRDLERRFPGYTGGFKSGIYGIDQSSFAQLHRDFSLDLLYLRYDTYLS
jgi:hypothetical protein